MWWQVLCIFKSLLRMVWQLSTAILSPQSSLPDDKNIKPPAPVLTILIPQSCRPSTVWVIYQQFTTICEPVMLLKTSWTRHFICHTSAKALQHFYCWFSQWLSKFVCLLLVAIHFATLKCSICRILLWDRSRSLTYQQLNNSPVRGLYILTCVQAPVYRPCHHNLLLSQNTLQLQT